MDAPPLPPRPDQLPAWAPPPPVEPTFRYASFWIRVGAYLIDTLLLIPLTIPFFIVSWSRISQELDRASSTGEAFRLGAAMGNVAVWTLTIAALSYAYAVLMVRYFGGTLGKLAVGIRVRVAGTGAVAGWREALLRPVLQLIVGFASFVPGARFITLLDDLWMLWDAQSQTLHDKVANTIVVYAR